MNSRELGRFQYVNAGQYSYPLQNPLHHERFGEVILQEKNRKLRQVNKKEW
jgi:hypothetical protein